MDNIKLGYIAGIIDSNGSMMIRNVNNEFCLTMSLSTTNKKLIEFMVENFGGNYCVVSKYKGNKKKHYEWKIAARRIQEILPKIAPYLILKKEKAEILLEFLKTLSHSNKKLSPEVTETRMKLYNRIVELHIR